jgi:phosphodiesterase/alkaline phosphatase D-like protein
MYMWDDHDFGGNNSDGSSAARPAAQTAYKERVPHYPLNTTDGAVYQSWVVGRVRFILTDLRSNASKTSSSDSSTKTKMGDKQLQWFFSELRKPEPLKVWISTHPWIQATTSGSDKWGSFATERKKIANFIKSSNLEGRVMLLSGDMHGIAIDAGSNADYADGGGANIPVFHAAPLHRDESIKGGPYSKGTFLNGSSGNQYGVMNITDSGGSTISVEWLGKRGSTTVVSHSFTAPGTTYVPPTS